MYTVWNEKTGTGVNNNFYDGKSKSELECHRFDFYTQSHTSRDSVTRFSTILFLLNWFDLGPRWKDKNSFAKFFLFAKIFDRKLQKSHVLRSQRLCRHAMFSLGTEDFIFLIIALWGVNTPKYFFNL